MNVRAAFVHNLSDALASVARLLTLVRFGDDFFDDDGGEDAGGEGEKAHLHDLRLASHGPVADRGAEEDGNHQTRGEQEPPPAGHTLLLEGGDGGEALGDVGWCLP